MTVPTMMSNLVTIQKSLSLGDILAFECLLLCSTIFFMCCNFCSNYNCWDILQELNHNHTSFQSLLSSYGFVSLQLSQKRKYQKMILNIFVISQQNSLWNKILGCRDPRCKHEYLDSPWFDRNITGWGGWGWWWKWQTYISTRS